MPSISKLSLFMISICGFIILTSLLFYLADWFEVRVLEDIRYAFSITINITSILNLSFISTVLLVTKNRSAAIVYFLYTALIGFPFIMNLTKGEVFFPIVVTNTIDFFLLIIILIQNYRLKSNTLSYGYKVFVWSKILVVLISMTVPVFGLLNFYLQFKLIPIIILVPHCTMLYLLLQIYKYGKKHSELSYSDNLIQL